MRKLFYLLVMAFSLVFTGCLETTEEITLTKDGSGTVVFDYRLDGVFDMLGLSNGIAPLRDKGYGNADSTIELHKRITGIPELTDKERELAKKGTMQLKTNLDKRQARVKISFSFKEFEDIEALRILSSKMIGTLLEENNKSEESEDITMFPIFDQYYKMTFSKNGISRTIDKAVHDEIGEKEYLMMMEAVDLGLNIRYNYLIHLPKPAKESGEFKGTLLNDNKTLKMSGNLSDFLDEPEKFEFNVKF